MNPLLESLAGHFRTTHQLLHMCLSDLDRETATRRARGNEGPSILWIVGHLLEYRSKMLGLLGVSREPTFSDIFNNQSATDGSNYPTMDEILAEWDVIQGELESALPGVDTETLLQPSGEAGPHGEKRPLDDLVFVTWHESYHMGQLGALRKSMGMPGPADLVMAARAQG